MSIADLTKAIEGIAQYRSLNRLEFYIPYPFQKAFHYAREGQVYESGRYDIGEGLVAEERALISANQIGKTLSAAMEVSFHLTGLYPKAKEHFYPELWPGTDVKCPFAGEDIYPDGWEGFRFTYAPSFICIGKSNDSVMKVIQNELMGDPLGQPETLGTGSIPKSKIIKTYRKPGVVNAFSAVTVAHVSGKSSKVFLMAYEQDTGAMMGIRNEGIWADEEPPLDVMSQMKRSQLSRKEKCIISTFTPEDGMTEIVNQLLTNQLPYQAVIRATWDDAPHMTEDEQEKRLSKFPPYERDMRSRGIPMVGSGLVFPIDEESIKVEPFSLPDFWPRICGIDFGWDHPFASAWLAWDRDTDTVYVYDCYRESKALPPMHASTIKHKSGWCIPVTWPHDGLNTDKGSGIPLAIQYRKEGLNLLPLKFSNPPGPQQKEGQGGNGVEAGLFDMLTRMEESRFKVFSNLTEWFEEFRQYHRKDGKIVALREDLMSATRYADMSLRFASVRPIVKKRKATHQSMRNW